MSSAAEFEGGGGSGGGWAPVTTVTDADAATLLVELGSDPGVYRVDIKSDNSDPGAFFSVLCYPNSRTVAPPAYTIRNWFQGNGAGDSDYFDPPIAGVVWSGEPYGITAIVRTRAAPSAGTEVICHACAQDTAANNLTVISDCSVIWTDDADQIEELLFSGPAGTFLSGTEVTVQRMA